MRNFGVNKSIAASCAVILLASSGVQALQQAIGSRVVLATVTDTGNRALTLLGPDDFAVEEDGHSRDILSLHMADYPMAILLDDTDGGVADRDAIRAAAARFISKIGQRAVAVGTLTDPAHLLASFEAGRAAVLERLARFEPQGGTPRPLQAAAALARAVRDTGSPFAAIVIVSAQAIDVADASDREFLTPILATGAPIYVIAKRASGAGALPGASGGDDVLHALADQTHGQYTVIYSSASYAIALDRLSDRLATEMMIEYVVPGAEPLTGDVRIGVKILGAKATGLGVSK